MTHIKYLITGATGATGSEAVTALREAGQDVRALVHREDERSARLRQQGVEVVLGDLLDLDAVRASLAGVRRAYFVYPVAPGIVQATAQFAQTAREAGVEAVVNMSQKPARADARSHASRQHWLAERVFDWSGVPVTHLRPTFFSEWLLYMAAMIRGGTIYAPYGSGRHAFIAAADQGRIIAAILQHPTPHAGQTYPLYGPTERTWPETAALVGHTLGRTVGYQQVPFAAFEEAFTASLKAARKDGDTVDFGFLFQHLREAAHDHQNGVFSGTNDVVERITGRPALTVEDFISKHREVFTLPPTGIEAMAAS